MPNPGTAKTGGPPPGRVVSQAEEDGAVANRSTRTERQPAAELPVARVCVDVPLPHLDRLFDYLVPAELHETAQPGTRVKVRFAGQLVDGWLIDRAAESAVPKLAYLEKLVSPERVLTPEVAGLARAIADRYAGSLADVLRLAVPPRHARAEQAPRSAGADLAAPPEGADPAASPEAADPAAPSEGADLARGASREPTWLRREAASPAGLREPTWLRGLRAPTLPRV